MGKFINAMFRKNSILKKLETQQDGFFCLEGEALKKYQACILNITKDIITACEEENVAYILGGGSALGAVRHGGFIPWDDDMDINMLGSDYKRFKKNFERKYGAKYRIFDMDTEDYYETMIRVCLKDSVYRSYFSTSSDGIFVDIFLIENTYDNVILRKLHGLLCMTIGALFSCRKGFAERKFFAKIAKDNPKYKAGIYCSFLIGGALSISSFDTLVPSSLL